MSLSDYRQLIDIYGGDYIGVECSNGVDIIVGINGEQMIYTAAAVWAIVAKLRTRMIDIMGDGMNAKFTFGFGGATVKLNYYDAGILLDALVGAARLVA